MSTWQIFHVSPKGYNTDSVQLFNTSMGYMLTDQLSELNVKKVDGKTYSFLVQRNIEVMINYGCSRLFWLVLLCAKYSVSLQFIHSLSVSHFCPHFNPMRANVCDGEVSESRKETKTQQYSGGE